MSPLKKIFTLKKETVKEINETLGEEEVQKEKLSFFQSSYSSSKKCDGNPKIFKACLKNVYMDYKGKCRETDSLQKELKKPYVEEQGKQEIELKKRKTVIGLQEESIGSIEEKIIRYKHDIVEVKRSPETYGLDVEKKPIAQFYLGIIVLVPITFYLLVFYMSASFSAFFKDFESGELSTAIFDGHAFTKAMEGGLLEGVFIVTIPFAFMGLGYLVHMFQKEKSWKSSFKVGLLFMITFVFDAILAYQIEMKIYNIEKTPDSLPFDVSVAISKVEFWGIIFAGFVVYIIWGLVFDFIMKEYDNFDKIKTFISTKREEITNEEEQITKLLEKLHPVKEEVSGIEGKIDDLQRTIDGFVFSNKHYLTYHTEYVKGWYLSIADHLPLKRREQVLESCESVETEHLEEHQINNENSEGVLYKLIN